MQTYKSLHKQIFKKPLSDFKLQRKFAENRQEASMKPKDEMKN